MAVAALSYSAFTPFQRITIITICSLSALISPLSATLYVPALPAVAESLNVSFSKVNLTITSYLILQGLSPSIWASVGESLGRKLLYVTLLTVYIGACIGLAITNEYGVVVGLRALQALGSAPAVALGAGVISDLIHVSERGKYTSNFMSLAGIGTAFGPVLGGVLAQYAGWHSIFIFLASLGGFVCILIFVFVPETQRSHVGDGSLPSRKITQPFVPWLKCKTVIKVDEDGNKLEPVKRGLKLDLMGPVRVLKEKDMVCCVLYAGVCFMVWQMQMVSTSSQYSQKYGLGEMHIGLTYIATGAGGLVGSVVTGRILQYDYKKQLVWETDHDIVNSKDDDSVEHVTGAKKEVEYIERARIWSLRYPTALYILTIIGFGWSIEKGAHIAVPICLSFLFGALNTSILAAFCKFFF
jgi:MFS family permease